MYFHPVLIFASSYTEHFVLPLTLFLNSKWSELDSHMKTMACGMVRQRREGHGLPKIGINNTIYKKSPQELTPFCSFSFFTVKHKIRTLSPTFTRNTATHVTTDAWKHSSSSLSKCHHKHSIRRFSSDSFHLSTRKVHGDDTFQFIGFWDSRRRKN